MRIDNKHAYYLDKCLEIAENNPDTTTNQATGAIVLNRYGEIVGTGSRTFFFYHLGKKHKCVHAEALALQEAEEEAKGGILYSSFEPCKLRWHNSVSWKLPSCCSLIFKYGIKKCVFACRDSKFGGEGKEWLEAHGIQVVDYTGYRKAEFLALTKTKDFKVDKGLEEEFKEFNQEHLSSKNVQ